MTGRVFYGGGGCTVDGRLPEANADMALEKNR